MKLSLSYILGAHRVRAIAMAGMVLLGNVAWAANPADWWIDVRQDRDARISTRLSQGADPNELSPQGQPALMLAIREGSWKVYDLLASDPRVDVNVENAHGETPLMYLAIVGDTRRAEALIRRGAQVNRLGWTPLQYAASKGQADTVKMLLRHEAIVNAPGPDGTTALMMAALAGDENTVRVLLQAGADPTMQTLEKKDASDWARLRNHNALAKKLDVLIEDALETRAASRTPGARPAAPSPVKSSPHEAKPETGASTSTGNSTSRYFDLKRFETEDAGDP